MAVGRSSGRSNKGELALTHRVVSSLQFGDEDGMGPVTIHSLLKGRKAYFYIHWVLKDCVFLIFYLKIQWGMVIVFNKLLFN